MRKKQYQDIDQDDDVDRFRGLEKHYEQKLSIRRFKAHTNLCRLHLKDWRKS